MEVDARRALLLRPSYSVVRAPHLPAVRGAHGVRPAGHGAQRLRRGPHGKGDVPGWIYWSPANATLSSKRGYPKLRAQVHSGHSALKGVACKSAPRLESCPLDSHTHEPGQLRARRADRSPRRAHRGVRAQRRATPGPGAARPAVARAPWRPGTHGAARRAARAWSARPAPPALPAEARSLRCRELKLLQASKA